MLGVCLGVVAEHPMANSPLTCSSQIEAACKWMGPGGSMIALGVNFCFPRMTEAGID